MNEENKTPEPVTPETPAEKPAAETPVEKPAETAPEEAPKTDTADQGVTGAVPEKAEETNSPAEEEKKVEDAPAPQPASEPATNGEAAPEAPKPAA